MATATYIPIATQTLGSAAASITFSSIPGTYTDLRLVLSNFLTVTGSQPIKIQFNSDTATNYSTTLIYGAAGGGVGSQNTTSATSITGFPLAFGSGGTTPMMADVDIMSYAGGTNKTCLVKSVSDFNGTGDVNLVVGLWRSTAAITSITALCSPNLLTGTIATLWGI
jgi:hypothetical protein